MADANATNTPPATLDDDDEALLAAARAQLEAAQARIVEWKAHEAEAACQKEAQEHEAREQLEREVEDFLVSNQDWVVVEHVRWVEEVKEEYRAKKWAARN